MDFLFAGLGLVILVLAGDMLVRSAVNLSLRLGVPPLIIGLTIVALGTSAPELLVSVQAVLAGAPGIAIGNVVGSNIANILLVLGVPAMMSGLHTSDHDTRQSYVQMIAVTVLFIGLSLWGPLTWISGVVLLAIYAAIMLNEIRKARAHRNASTESDILDTASTQMSWPKTIFFLVVGLIGLPLGANILVDSASVIARSFGISETVIGLTLVAVGTSLPELATTVVAAIRRQSDVALGNVLGSNIANILVIISTSSFFGAIPVSAQVLHFDMWVMLIVALMIYPFVFHKMDISRGWGIGLTTLYLGYLVVLLG